MLPQQHKVAETPNINIKRKASQGHQQKKLSSQKRNQNKIITKIMFSRITVVSSNYSHIKSQKDSAIFKQQFPSLLS